MNRIKVGINGFGRIGRNVFKIAFDRNDIEIVGINDLTDTKTLAHLLKYDSTQGKFERNISFNATSIIVEGIEIPVSAERNPGDIPWQKTPDVIIEATGIFRSKESAKGGYGDHLKNGAKKVILTVPAKDDVDAMVVLGVNDEVITPDVQCVSNASCTTNCMAPIVKILLDNFGIERGLMTTIHSYTNDQNILDGPHSDLRRARSCAVSQIPTTTGAAKAVGTVIPELQGKLDGMAIRVPTPTGSCVDLVVILKKDVTKEEVHKAIREAAEGSMKGIVEYTEEPIVSVDIIHNSHSAIFDAGCTMLNGRMLKTLTWYDNEWGYSTRVVELIPKLMS
ncbi:MAG: type I glyceraldehyde-3-phosphate dehydrogenase [Bacteroidales bacterium]|nr:type I glyceraldehyde-3-phosphate dehydrogenase [Bacteroidales bacterium]MDD4217605.1 type I glyceraldehyde-3-phosphate dehydrogenase [Bacteroidales bacterium]MDY0141929.1 type I glyceraldehyde-3-phosphate dehydrogenase [Bacteroidales bacterium]